MGGTAWTTKELGDLVALAKEFKEDWATVRLELARRGYPMRSTVALEGQWRKTVMGPECPGVAPGDNRTGALDAVRQCLLDGRWHTMGELVGLTEHLIRFESATRVFARDAAANQSGRGRITKQPADFDYKVMEGRRRVLTTYLNQDRLGFPIEYDWDPNPWARKVRIKEEASTT